MIKKKFVLPFILSILGLTLLGAFYMISKRTATLISPFFGGKDETERIAAKIDVSLRLDFSKSKTLSTLEKVPRYLVYNSSTGTVYYAKDADVRISPASFTKLLSAQVALDFISTSEVITVKSKSIAKVPTVLGLKEGESLPVSDLLRGAIATSANDAAQVLADGAAEKLSLYTSEFIYYMNKKADLLGMGHSHFTNPDGLDDQNQYSTLSDIAKMVNNVQKNYPDILDAGKSDNQDIEKTDTHGKYYLPNWNGLLGVYPGVTGLKIAYTETAGYSTIVTADREGYRMVAIVSGTDSYLERDRAAADLLDAAFLTQGLAPAQVSKTALNRRYKIWGDLARKIKTELKLLEGGK